MKEGIYGEALLGAVKVIKDVSDSLIKEFKGVKPFDTEEVSQSQMLQSYDNITPLQMDEMVQTYGADTMSKVIQVFEELKRRKQGNG